MPKVVWGLVLFVLLFDWYWLFAGEGVTGTVLQQVALYAQATAIAVLAVGTGYAIDKMLKSGDE